MMDSVRAFLCAGDPNNATMNLRWQPWPSRLLLHADQKAVRLGVHQASHQRRRARPRVLRCRSGGEVRVERLVVHDRDPTKVQRHNAHTLQRSQDFVHRLP